jgi:trimethylamine corrinoid protein
MADQEIFERLRKAVVEMDADASQAAAQEVIEKKIDPLSCIEQGLSVGMKEIGDMFDRAEIYVPQIIFAAEAFSAAIDILAPHIKGGYSAKAKLIAHTVEGDIHDIGKSIFVILARANGFEVIDLGRDVPVTQVVDQALASKVDFITGSALMTTTMPAQREIIKELKDRGVRDQFKVIFGGAPTTQEWVDSIEGDGWAENAAEGVNLLINLTG